MHAQTHAVPPHVTPAGAASMHARDHELELKPRHKLICRFYTELGLFMEHVLP